MRSATVCETPVAVESFADASSQRADFGWDTDFLCRRRKWSGAARASRAAADSRGPSFHYTITASGITETFRGFLGVARGHAAVDNGRHPASRSTVQQARLVQRR